VDEARVARVQSRAEGWIEQVHVDTTGRAVKRGEALVHIYSPELVASQQEYLLALKARETMHHSSMENLHASGDALVEAARARLEGHWRLDAATLAEVERRGEPVRSIAIPAPINGYVLTRNAYANQRVTPEMELYTLADLSRVWIMADVPEADAAGVRLGQAASVELVSAPGRRIMARVTNLGPQMDPQTRTLKVRLEADNPHLALRPELFVNVEFHTSTGKHLRVAEDAVIDTGLVQTVYVDKGNGVFEPRRVQTGERGDGKVEILSGLDAGERIALSGAFLLDSESKMRGVAPQPQSAGQPHD
jgi:Cu(I)/Ag(I) efflux system membrane fusion protein